MRLMSLAAALALLAAAGCAQQTDEMPDDSLSAADSADAADPGAASPDAAAPAAESGGKSEPPAARRPARRDTTPAQKREGMSRKDSLLLERELERIRNEPRRVPPYPPAERPPEDAGSPTRE